MSPYLAPTTETATSLPPSTDDIHSNRGHPSRSTSPGTHAHVTIIKNGLEALLRLFGLSDDQDGHTNISNAVLVSIDFENIGGTKVESDSHCQAGISILDLKEASSCPPEDLMRTFNFATGSPTYCERAKKKFVFGETRAIKKKDMLAELESCIPEDRDIVLVGHDIRNDLVGLRNLKWTFHKRVIATLDTHRMSGQVLPYFALRLGELLWEFGCPSASLHCAGNDAYFTLRALLHLAARGCRNDRMDSQNFAILKRIADSPICRRLYQHEKNEKRKQERRQKTKKYQAKFWDEETKEKIRAERAARKFLGAQDTLGRSPDPNLQGCFDE